MAVALRRPTFALAIDAEWRRRGAKMGTAHVGFTSQKNEAGGSVACVDLRGDFAQLGKHIT